MDLSLFSYNTHFLPFSGLSKTNISRAFNISNKILGLSPDVIALQEVFDPKIRAIFKKQLCSHYQIVAPSNYSGLFTATTLPIASSDFFQFSKNHILTADFLAEKGVLGVESRVGDLSFFFINSHLQASYHYINPTKTRCSQLLEIYDFCSSIIDFKSKNCLSFLLGDMNIPYSDKDEFRLLSDILKVSPHLPTHRFSNTLDYICTLNSFSSLASPVIHSFTTLENFTDHLGHQLSDHLPILSKISVSNS